MVRNPLANPGDRGWIPGLGRLATHSSILAWKIQSCSPWSLKELDTSEQLNNLSGILDNPCLSFLSLSNRLLRRCVPADFLNALGWMSLTQAQAATSLSAKWEEGRCVVSNTVDPGAYHSSFLDLPSQGE